MAPYRYHYTTLSQTQKELYKLINKNIGSYGNSIKLPLVHANEINIAFDALLLDDPMIFNVGSYQYSKDLNKKRIEFIPDYKFSQRTMRQYESDIAMSLSSIRANKNISDYDKVMYVHDYILSNFTYDYTFSEHSHTILGLTKNKKGVCEGIAKYVKLALDFLSIKSIVVNGHAVNPAYENDSKEPHAWNMIEADGGWYYLDATFDLTIKNKANRYDYFLVSHEDIKKSHSTNQKLPMTSGIPMDYYSLNGLAISNFAALERFINDNLARGHRIMQFKFLNAPNNVDVSEKVLKAAGEQFQRLFNCGYSIQSRFNNRLWVFEVEFSAN